MLKPVVERSLCEGHGRCEQAAPAVFRVDDDDKSAVIMPEVPEELRARVEQAVKLCPRQAIRIE